MRVCILADERPFVHLQGSSTYLDHLVRSLAPSGAEVHLRILQPPRRDQLRFRLEPRFLDPFASIALHGAGRRGADFYARDPRNWLGGAGRRSAGGRGPLGAAPAGAGGGGLGGGRGRAARAGLGDRQLLQRRRGLRRLPPGPSKAILAARRLRLRARSLAALGGRRTSTRAMIAREAAAFRAADLVLAIKPEEAAQVAALAPGTAVATLPFAVDIPETDLAAPRPPVALFVGAINPPNADALGWLLAEIWPALRRRRPDARLRVVGRSRASAGALARRRRAGRLRADLAAEYAGAAVALAPIRFGSGVKIKLVEAPGARPARRRHPGRRRGPRRPAAAGPAHRRDRRGLRRGARRHARRPRPGGGAGAARAAAAAHYARDAVARRLAADLDRVRAG